jgi:hypothetical protein
MDSWTIINIVLNVITIVNSFFTVIVSIGILLIIMIFHRQTRSVPILLASYTCLTILLSATMLTSMTMSSLFGFIGIYLYEYGNTVWCRWCGFFIHGFLCALYDSYGLQAIFRCFRVVFPRRKILHSFKLYYVIIPFEMIFAIICISPVLFLNDVIYLPSEFYCQTPLTNLPAILYVALRLYGFPLFILFGIYWYLVRYIRRTTPLAETVDARRRARNNARDLIVIKKLLIIVILLVLLGLPAIIFLIMFILTGHLPSITYRIAWLSVSLSLIFLAFMLVKYTIPLRDTVKRLINNIIILKRRITSQLPMQTRIERN